MRIYIFTVYANLSMAVSKSQFAAHVREMRRERDSSFEKEYNVIVSLLHTYT